MTDLLLFLAGATAALLGVSLGAVLSFRLGRGAPPLPRFLPGRKIEVTDDPAPQPKSNPRMKL